jgi:16S rRNA (cytosine967-C5)-methyltransferase
MAQPSARRIALAALRRWREDKRLADSIISRFLARAELAYSERAFALELFYGVLRNLTLLDFWIGCLRSSQVEASLRDLLRLGLYQLFFLETAQHAAVYETVELASKRQRGVTNAVLRAAARQRDDLLRRAGAQPLAIRTSHPQFLVARWEQHFGVRDAEELCRWNNLPPPIYGRINRLKINREEFLQVHPGSRPVTHNYDFVEFDTLPANALNEGHCYIQDLSTVIACQLLDPKPTEKILDACAAPGGKTGYIAQLMKNKGTIVACDRDAERLNILKDNMARLGAGIVQISRHDWTRDRVQEDIASVAPFDRILVDTPCSNTGVMRRRVDVRWRLRTGDLTRMPDEQFRITCSVVSLLKPGGVLVYSTCSLETEENEQLIARVLDQFPQMQLTDQEFCLPFRDHFDGAFVARLVRTRQVQNDVPSDFVEKLRKMTNDEARRNDETRKSKTTPLILSSFAHSGLFRHSTFVPRHFASIASQHRGS